jgi:hypothetical protein
MPKILNGSFSSAVKSAYEVNRLDNNSVKLKVLPVIDGEAAHRLDSFL